MQITHRLATIIGIAVGSLTAGVYLIGSGRAFDYDSAATVETFIRTGSLTDPFRRQVAFNNHPFFSFLEHVIYTLTGSASEWAMRPLPILFAAATVGLLVGTLAARRSLWIGLAAGVLLALNPLFIAETRAVRGYSLLCLCAVASSLLLDRLERTRPGQARLCPGRGDRGSHPPLHARCRDRPHRVDREPKAPLALLGADLGRGRPVRLIRVSRADAGDGAVKQAAFPPDLPVRPRARAPRAQPDPRRRRTRRCHRCYLDMEGQEGNMVRRGGRRLGCSRGVARRPQFLFPRFFVWLLPGVVTLAAVGLARVRLLPLAALVVVVLPGAAHSFTRDPIANRAAAVAIQPLIRDGLKVCSFVLDYGGLSVYTTDLKPIHSLADLKRCDATVSIVSKDATQQLMETNAAQFPFVTTLPAEVPGVIRSRSRLDAAEISYRYVEPPFPAMSPASP